MGYSYSCGASYEYPVTPSTNRPCYPPAPVGSSATALRKPYIDFIQQEPKSWYCRGGIGEPMILGGLDKEGLKGVTVVDDRNPA